MISKAKQGEDEELHWGTGFKQKVWFGGWDGGGGGIPCQFLFLFQRNAEDTPPPPPLHQ